MSDITQDDINLDYYEGIRKQLVAKLVLPGVPTDPEMGGLLLKALDGGVKTILTKKRLTADKEVNENMAITQQLIAEVLRATPTNKQKLNRTEALPEIDFTAPKPGEVEIGTKEVRYNKIMEKD